MKKIVIGLISIFLIAGCGMGTISTSPTKEVETILGKYQSTNEAVLSQLDTAIANENMTATQSSKYRELMTRQYTDLTYNIKDETIDGNNAIVTVEVEVYDYAKALKTVDAYVDAHLSEFSNENGNMSNTLYTDYKLTELAKVSDRIKYTIDFNLTKTNDTWTVDNLSETDLQKIHGIYIL